MNLSRVKLFSLSGGNYILVYDDHFVTEALRRPQIKSVLFRAVNW